MGVMKLKALGGLSRRLVFQLLVKCRTKVRDRGGLEINGNDSENKPLSALRLLEERGRGGRSKVALGLLNSSERRTNALF